MSASAPRRVVMTAMSPGPNSGALLPALDAVEPGTDAGHQVVVAVDHLHGPAQAVARVGEPHRARLLAQLGREPGAVVAPQARPLLALARLPVRHIDAARAPAVLDHEGGWRPGIERRDPVAAMTPERDRKP